MSKVLGGQTLDEAQGMLEDFWNKFRCLYPNHQIFADPTKPLAKCIPLMLHGDEGVHFKKNGLLVLHMQGIIGHGCSKRGVELDGIPINFLRSGFHTRLLILVCPKDTLGVTYSCFETIPCNNSGYSCYQWFTDLNFYIHIHPSNGHLFGDIDSYTYLAKSCVLPCPAQELYHDDRRIWNALFEIAIQDLRDAERHGIYIGGSAGTIFPIILANKGDWSYLVFWHI